MTAIEWTDETWNPVVGCSIVSPGCTNCYAMRMAHRLAQMGGKVAEKYAGLTKAVKGKPVWTGTARLHPEVLEQPLRWRKPRMIFVNSMSDLFHEALSDRDILRVLDVIRRCSFDGGSGCGTIDGEHIFQVLTKRAERMAAFMRRLRFNGEAPPDQCGLYLADDGRPPVVLKNLWLGASVEDQKRADERRDDMRAIAALGWLTWVSYEPALGGVDWSGWAFLRWLVSGGESGPDARPSHPDWHRAARDWCARHGIAFLFKQWGAFVPTEISRSEFLAPSPEREGEQVIASAGEFIGYPIGDTFHIMRRVGKKSAGRLLDGVLHDAYPASGGTLPP